MSTKKAAKPAAKKPATKSAAKKPAVEPTARPDAKGVVELVEGLGSRESVDAMIIAVGMVSLGDNIGNAVAKTVSDEIARMVNSLHSIVENNKANAEALIHMLKRTLTEVAPRIAKSISEIEISLVADGRKENGFEPIRVFSTSKRHMKPDAEPAKAE